MGKSMTKGKFVSFGEIMIRLGAPDYLKLIQTNTFDISYAGAEANVAVSLANYGLKTEFITCLPNNPIAERCIMDLRGHKVGVDYIQRSGKRIGILYLEKGSNTRPSKVYYDREGSSIATIVPGSIPWEDILIDANWFHWSGITPALSENTAFECKKAIEICNKRGITVSCDINYRNNLWSYGKPVHEVMTELVKGCDIIMANEEDCEKVFGIKPENLDVCKTNGDINVDSFRYVCKKMMSKFQKCKMIAMTIRGAINANHNTWAGILFDGQTFFQSQRYNITDIVDRVGGGDSFMGALIYGLNHYSSKQDALEFATAASCIKHTIKGDYNYATIEDVEALSNGDASGRIKR